jgi:hypothetical protein
MATPQPKGIQAEAVKRPAEIGHCEGTTISALGSAHIFIGSCAISVVSLSQRGECSASDEKIQCPGSVELRKV